MEMFFAPAARQYIEDAGGIWGEDAIRPLSLEEARLIKPNITELDVGLGASKAELDDYIKKHQRRGRRGRAKAG